MKIYELEIFDTRGIRDLHLKLDGKNVVICGPNGSGKSGVVDSLDFLLTGDISRLSGSGTKDISLTKHGPHVASVLAAAKVRAKIKIEGDEELITIERGMDHPKILICDPKEKSDKLKDIMLLAGRRQHVLTRREILRYITSAPSDRAEQIQELLNLNEVENTRDVLVKTDNLAKKEVEINKRAVESAITALTSEMGVRNFDQESLSKQVNEHRSTLGGEALSEINSLNIKNGLTALADDNKKQEVDISLLKDDIEHLLKILTLEEKALAKTKVGELYEIVNKIRSDKDALHAISHAPLLEKGLSLLDGSGRCPLCDHSWSNEKLKMHLEEKLSAIKETLENQRKIDNLSSELRRTVESIKSKAEQIVKIANLLNSEHQNTLSEWVKNLEEFIAVLHVPLEKFHNNFVESLFSEPSDSEKILSEIYKVAEEKYPKMPQTVTALEKLTRLETALKSLEGARTSLSISEALKSLTSTVLETYYTARDSVLLELFKEIADRFSELYRKLHDHEDEFAAELVPDGAGLKLEVDFHGKGKHPPHALHSEGHQDSMGLCLYLTLSERLTGGVIDLLILDDVVMSVDSLHRRQICEVLNQFFKHRQFVITTHEWIWAHQLKAAGVTNRKGIIEFYDWDIDSGPKVNYDTDIWDRIDNDLKKNDVPAAAAKLRRGSEQFFAIVCHNLQAPVPYKMDGKMELGDLMKAATTHFRGLISKGKEAANSWGKMEEVNYLTRFENEVNDIFKKYDREQGAVNNLVHFNEWANYSVPDFKPVVAAYKDLFKVFVCGSCDDTGGEIKIVSIDNVPTGVNCGCDSFKLNLQIKPKSSKSSEPVYEKK